MKVRHVEPSASSPTDSYRSTWFSDWHDGVEEHHARPRATDDVSDSDEFATSDEGNDDESTDDSSEPYVVAYARWLLGEIDWSVTGWMATYRVRLIQLALGVIFLWFGGLKIVPGLSPAEGLVVSTAHALLAPIGLSPPGRLVVVALALWEVAIGLGFLLDRHRKAMVWMLILHMFSTALPLVLLPEAVWTHAPYALTLEGQYIVKNLVILAGVATVGATVHGGYLNWAPPRNESGQSATADESDAPAETLATTGAAPIRAGHDERPLPEPPGTVPRVWVVDEGGSLVATYELDGYYRDCAPPTFLELDRRQRTPSPPAGRVGGDEANWPVEGRDASRGRFVGLGDAVVGDEEPAPTVRFPSRQRS